MNPILYKMRYLNRMKENKMKIIIDRAENESKPRTYPYIGVSPAGDIVLFTTKDKGVCLQAVTPYVSVGSYSQAWNEQNFKPFDGFITLEND